VFVVHEDLQELELAQDGVLVLHPSHVLVHLDTRVDGVHTRGVCEQVTSAVMWCRVMYHVQDQASVHDGK
jgi:hypothetical protein